MDISKHTDLDGDDEGEVGEGTNGGEGESKSRRAQPKKVRLAPQGARASLTSRALERAPDVKILTDPEEIADKGLKGRAGKFYKESQELFINGLYPVTERMSAELEAEFSGSADPDEIREATMRAARKSMAFRVGKAVCYALSKRLMEDWSVNDLDTATSPESLSLAADDYRQSVAIAKKWIKQFLKLNQLEDVAAT